MTQPTSTGRRARLAAKLTLLSVGLATVGVLATSGVSQAHNRAIVANCYRLEVSFLQYQGPATNNTITVTIDGVAQPSVTFAESYTNTYPWNPGLAHTYTVFVDANVSNGPSDVQYDTTDTGSSTPCVDTTAPGATTTTAPGATTTTAPGATTTTAQGATTTTAQGATTTTAPGATTTTSSSTTTVAGTTTTSVSSGGPTGSTTTTTIPTTTTVRATTTTIVAVQPPTVTRAAGSSGALPVTGSDTGTQLTLAMAVLLAGAGLVVITRRRTRDVAEES